MLPHIQNNDRPHDSPCIELVRLQEKVITNTVEIDEMQRDLRPLIELAAQMKLLMSLSIGGGALAMINLALFLLDRFP